MRKTSLHRFEKNSIQVLPVRQYLRRQLVFLMYGSLLIAISLAMGVAGYMNFAHQNFIDAFYNSSMILTGMGPASEMPSDSAKIFASFYSLYSGVAFLTTSGIMFAPLVHRILHLLHVDDETRQN